jgi:uncharacterized protein YdiU (UPF0061 family)
VVEEGSEEAALDSAREALGAFGVEYETARDAGLRRKLGLITVRKEDSALSEDLLQRMEANGADFTMTFRLLCDAVEGAAGDARVRALFAEPGAYDTWAVGWRRRLQEEPTPAGERARAMRRVNPMFIPRNHLVQSAIDSAIERQDFQRFRELLDVVTRPYEDRSDKVHYATPARPEECVVQTFCGT